MKSKKKYNKRIFSGVLSAVMLVNFCTVMPISAFANDDEIQEIISDNGHRYQLFDTSMNWNEAEAYCESLGGHLLTINSDEEQQLINNNILSIGTKNTYYIGMYRDNNAGEWKWITNESVDFFNWDEGEPNNTNENYVHMYRGMDIQLRIPMTAVTGLQWFALSHKRST